jgi:molybdopterin-guanine dinucleotide biosynthesis adapter protein
MTGGRNVPVVSVVGPSGVGKTTALESIIRELKRRGYRVGTVKHHAHGFELDTPGKDSWRHAQAGSEAVALVGAQQLAIIRRVQAELSLDDIVPLLGDVDIVLTEGYKRGDRPKLEVTRKEKGIGLLSRTEELIGILADYAIDLPVPQFALDDARGVVDLLEQLYLGDKGEDWE